jgi:hypothetical protein
MSFEIIEWIGWQSLRQAGGVGKKTIGRRLKRQQCFDAFPERSIVSTGALQKVAARGQGLEGQGFAKQILFCFSQVFHELYLLGIKGQASMRTSALVATRLFVPTDQAWRRRKSRAAPPKLISARLVGSGTTMETLSIAAHGSPVPVL